MKYSIGDRVRIIQDGWGCSHRIGDLGTIVSIHRKDHKIAMDDGSVLDYIWKEGFEPVEKQQGQEDCNLVTFPNEFVKESDQNYQLHMKLTRAVSLLREADNWVRVLRTQFGYSQTTELARQIDDFLANIEQAAEVNSHQGESQ